MTYQEYTRLSYQEKLHFPAAEYKKIVEADHAEYQKVMRRVELVNRLTRPVPWLLLAGGVLGIPLAVALFS